MGWDSHAERSGVEKKLCELMAEANCSEVCEIWRGVQDMTPLQIAQDNDDDECCDLIKSYGIVL
eukprot:1597123-Rhodomonas_salina.1